MKNIILLLVIAFPLILDAREPGNIAERAALVQNVDLIEVNHFYDENGKHVFDQLLFKDWSDRAGRHQVVDWKLIKSAHHTPQFNHASNRWVLVYHDAGYMRVIYGTYKDESWTQYDPELIERKFLPKEDRKKLLRLIK